MTKIDIISGFLGAGKTTFIKKLLQEAISGEQVVLIENEFGEIGIDGGFLKDSGIEIREMNSGCICCSLVGDFGKSLSEVLTKYKPDRIIIEPSGVGKLSDVMKAVIDVSADMDVALNSAVTIVDAAKCKMYMKNFGEFYDDQVSHASCILLSRTQTAPEDKVAAAVALLRQKNPTATIVTTDWNNLTGEQILKAMSTQSDFKAELVAMAAQANAEHEHEHHHHDHDEDEHEHHHHDHDGECCCGHDHEHEHHHDHDGECCCGHDHEHEHHHDHDGECCCGHDHEHEHHHDHDGECCCGHHHDHHADEVFTSWGVETARRFSKAEIEHALEELDSGKYGMILRSKGIVDGGADGWLEFDYVPGEHEVRAHNADIGGKLVVIGSKLDEAAIAALFGC